MNQYLYPKFCTRFRFWRFRHAETKLGYAHREWGGSLSGNAIHRTALSVLYRLTDGNIRKARAGQTRLRIWNMMPLGNFEGDGKSLSTYL